MFIYNVHYLMYYLIKRVTIRIDSIRLYDATVR